MFANYDFKPTVFKWPDLHKKNGRILVIEPTESDIAEGNFMRQVWFLDMDLKRYLLLEQDVRQDS